MNSKGLAKNRHAMAQMSDDERCDGMAQTGTVVISNGKARCRGAKKGHGTELRIDAGAMR